jgi:hypothetical protein
LRERLREQDKITAVTARGFDVGRRLSCTLSSAYGQSCPSRSPIDRLADRDGIAPGIAPHHAKAMPLHTGGLSCARHDFQRLQCNGDLQAEPTRTESGTLGMWLDCFFLQFKDPDLLIDVERNRHLHAMICVSTRQRLPTIQVSDISTMLLNVSYASCRTRTPLHHNP